jgi:bacteriocin-like protein
MKDFKSFTKILSKSELKSINGGFGGLFIGSSCYTTMSRCNTALASAISNGANPATSSCESCTTFSGSQGYMVQIRPY